MAREINEQEFRLIDGVSRGLVGIASGLKGLKTTMTELNQAAELASKGIGLVVGAAQKIGDSVQGVADYQTAMTRVNTATKATAEEQRALSEAVKSAAIDIGVTAETSSNILLKMARDGFSAQEAIDQLGVVLNYAKANAQDAAGATEQLGGILDSFGERPAIIGKLADALTATAQAAGTTTDALAKGLQGVGLAADEAGLSVNQTVALLGQLAQRNIEGSSATKQLVTILGEFRDPASAAGKALDGLGLSGKAFTEVLATLSTDSAAATEVLNTLGNKPRAALQALLADGGASLKGLNKIIAESEGASKKAADALGKTFNEALNKAGAAFEQLKIAAATPILTPLAEGLTALAARLTEVANSPEFANLANQFAQFTAKSTEQLILFVKSVNFEEAAGKVAAFVESTVRNFGAIVKAANLVAGALNFVVEKTVAAGEAIGNTAGATFGPLQIALEKAGGAVSDVSTRFDELKVAAAAPRKSLSELVNQTLGVKTGLDGVSKSARVSADELRALALAALPGPLRAVAEAAIANQDALNKMADAAANAAAAQEKLDRAAGAVSIAALESQLASLVRTQTLLINSGEATSAGLRGLTDAINATEQQIQTLKNAHEDAAKAAGDQTSKVNETSSALRDFGSAAESAGQSARDAGDKTDEAAKKIENFGSNAAAAAFDLGDMSSAFFEQTMQAASAQASIGDYLDVLNRGTAIYKDQALQFKRRLEISQQIIRANDEEAQAIDRLTNAYPALSRGALRELYEAEKKVADIRQKKNEVTAQGLNLEQAAARAASGTAGALGFGAGQNQGPQANQGAGAAGGGSVKGGNVININLNGTEVTPDQVVRALRRAEALGR